MVFFGNCEVDLHPHPELRLIWSVKEKRDIKKNVNGRKENSSYFSVT
jgi:hypothetical protein